MKEYVTTVKDEENNSVCFYLEIDKPFTIGEKMNELNEDAYMNGYNWEAFFNHYLEKKNPEILESMDTDSEAGMYVAFFPLNAENERLANQLVRIIQHLIENENELYAILEEEGDNIEWDQKKSLKYG